MNKVIKLIQGDDFGLDLNVIGGAEAEEIQDVIFSCFEENIIKEFTKINDNLYYLKIPSEETKSFIPKIVSFDITLRFNDGEIMTALFQNKLEVLKKRNKIEWNYIANKR